MGRYKPSGPYRGDENLKAHLKRIYGEKGVAEDTPLFDLKNQLKDAQGRLTTGFDIDLVAVDPRDGKLTLFEFCNVSQDWIQKGCSPHKSDPNRYWVPSGYKFFRQWQLVENHPNAKMVVVNYANADSDLPEQMRVMEVKYVDEKGMEFEDMTHDFFTFKDWLLEISEHGSKEMKKWINRINGKDRMAPDDTDIQKVFWGVD